MHKKCQLEQVCSHFIYCVNPVQVHSVTVKTWLYFFFFFLHHIVQHIILRNVYSGRGGRLYYTMDVVGG